MSDLPEHICSAVREPGFAVRVIFMFVIWVNGPGWSWHCYLRSPLPGQAFVHVKDVHVNNVGLLLGGPYILGSFARCFMLYNVLIGDASKQSGREGNRWSVVELVEGSAAPK